MGLSGNSFILKNDGTLWGCGWNGQGQLGLGDTNDRNAFTQITTDANNILLNGMDMPKVNELDKSKLIAGGFTGNIDFRIAMKTKDVNKTPSITKIYIEYKNN